MDSRHKLVFLPSKTAGAGFFKGLISCADGEPYHLIGNGHHKV